MESCSIARRLQACVRDVDTVARLGGDEFTIILSEMKKSADVTSVAEKIIMKLTDPIFLHDTFNCSVGASIGIAIYPEDGYELDKLISAADSAMYESKVNGKNTYTFFKGKKDEQAEQQPWIVLDAALMLGVPEIDLQHQELANMIGRMNVVVKQNAPVEVAVQMFDDIISYARFHFATEELLMDQYGYVEDEEHKQEHRRLIGEASYLREKL